VAEVEAQEDLEEAVVEAVEAVAVVEPQESQS
jgi:hypothetical protein